MTVSRLGLGAGMAMAAVAIAIVDGALERRHDTTGPDPALVPRRVAMIRDAHLPNMILTGHDGRARRFYDDLVRGKVVAINFMYAACTKTCELSSQNMARLQDELGDRLGRDVFLYSISLDPEHDTPDALRAYREKQGAKSGWTFLTGKTAEEVVTLRRKLGVYDPEPSIDADLSSHTGMIVLGNEPRGRWTMIPSLVHPIRIRQALDRIILQPSQWPRGDSVVEEVPREDRNTGMTLLPLPR